MKKLRLLLGILFVGNVFGFQQLIQKNIDWKRVNVIQVVLDGKHQVVTSIANSGKSLEYFVNKEHWLSAVNGAYFCPKDYPHCNGEDFSNAPRFYKWKNLSAYGDDFGINGVFAFDKKWNPFIVMQQIRGDVSDELKNINYNTDKIEDIYYGIWNFPVLLLDGKNMLWAYEEYLDRKMKAKWTKNFICYTKDRKTI